MVLPSVMFYFGVVYLALDILRLCGFKAPFRISSTPKGSTMPTALYVMIEDVVAVDGGGGQMYRYALRTRYLSSPYFRRMLVQMNFFWTGGSIVFAAAFTAIIFTVSEPVAFTVSAYSGVCPNKTLTSIDIPVRMDLAVCLGRSVDYYHHSLGTERPPSRKESLAGKPRPRRHPLHRRHHSANRPDPTRNRTRPFAELLPLGTRENIGTSFPIRRAFDCISPLGVTHTACTLLVDLICFSLGVLPNHWNEIHDISPEVMGSEYEVMRDYGVDEIENYVLLKLYLTYVARYPGPPCILQRH